VLRDNLDAKMEAPILCRTFGKTGTDGADGSCHQFASIEWCPFQESVLFAVDVTKQVHLFDVNQSNQAWPRRAVPIRTMPPPAFLRPSLSIFTVILPCDNSDGMGEAPNIGKNDDVNFFILDRLQNEEENDSSISFRSI